MTSEARLESGIKAGRNILELLGGREAVIRILEDSDHAKAQRLIDRLRSTVHLGEEFTESYVSVGLKAVDVLEIFSNVQQARVFIQAIGEADVVMSSVIHAAKDKLSPHDRCQGTGQVIDRKTGMPNPNRPCIPCQGSGYILLSGARDAQELYFTLLKWKQQGGLVNIDARRQNANVTVFGAPSPGEAPAVMTVIKRAEDVAMPRITDGSERVVDVPVSTVESTMPEDVLVAEEV